MQTIEEWSDSFNNQLTRGEKSRIDIPSPVGFNTERLKKITQGSVDPSTNFSEVDGHFEIETTGSTDDRFRLESHERVRYTPGFEAEVGVACRFPSDLQDGDRVLIGITDNNLPSDDGVQFLFDGPDNVKCRIRGGGTTRRETDADLPDDFDPKNPFIAKILYNLYGVGTCMFVFSYTSTSNSNKGDIQKNKKVAEISVNDDWTVDSFTLHVFADVAVDDSNNTTGSTIEVGSMQAVIRGDVVATDRQKSVNGFGLGGAIDSTSWTPLKAYRIDPNRDNIYVQLRALEGNPTDTMKLAAFAVDPSKTDASGFTEGGEVLSANSVMQTTTSVTTPTSPTNRQIGFVSVAGGSKNKSTVQEDEAVTPLYDDEIAVIMAKTKSASNASTDIVTKWTEEW